MKWSRILKRIAPYLLFLLVMATATLAVQTARAAEIKVGFVNAAKLLEQAPQAVSARNRLQQEFAPRDKKLVAEQSTLQKLEDKLAKNGPVMNTTERDKLEGEIIKQKRDLKRAQDSFREDLNIRQNQEFGKLQRTVYDAIVALAKQQKYDLILSQGVVYAGPRVDVTDQVLQRLKAEYKPQHSGNGNKK